MDDPSDIFTTLPDAGSVQGVVRIGDKVSIQWLVAHSNARVELQMPVAEARKLLGYLAQAYKEGGLT